MSLALYAAVIGTVGAVTGIAGTIISVISLRYKIKKDQIQLELSCYGNLGLAKPERYPAGHIINPHGQMMPLYHVKVTNKGTVAVPLNDVGIVDATGLRHSAEDVTATEPISNALVFVSPFDNGCTLAPRSTRTFSVFWHEGQSPFIATDAYVEDGTGKLRHCHVH